MATIAQIKEQCQSLVDSIKFLGVDITLINQKLKKDWELYLSELTLQLQELEAQEQVKQESINTGWELTDLEDIAFLWTDDNEIIITSKKNVEDTKSPQSIKQELVTTSKVTAQSRLTDCATTAILKCMVFINHAKVDINDIDVKLTAYRYVEDAIKFFQENNPSRLLQSDIPSIYDCNTIEIIMEQKFEYIYGTKNGSKITRIHNGKERKDLHDTSKQVSPPRWYKRNLSKAVKNREMNRKGTEFAINLISPSSKIENKQANDYTPEKLIFWNLYDRLPIINEHLSATHPDKVTLSNVTFVPYVHQIKVNGKFVISSLEILPSEVKQDRPVQNFTNKFKSGLLSNWSLPFQWEVFPNDWLYQKDANNSHLMQVALENDILVLYKLSESFKRKVESGTKQLIGKHHSQTESASMTQERTKIADLGSVELIKTNDIQWIATLPRYEYLAKQLNKSNTISDSEYDKYAGLSLTHDELKVADRVLCKKKNIGQSITVKGNYDPIIIINNKTLHVASDPACKWLSKIFDSARLKMIKSNVRELESKIQNATYQQDINLADKRVRDMLATMTTTYRKVIRSHNTQITGQAFCLNDSQMTVLAVNMVEYLVMVYNMNRAQLVDTHHKLMLKDDLKEDEYNKRCDSFDDLVKRVRKYIDNKSSEYQETVTNGLVTMVRKK